MINKIIPVFRAWKFQREKIDFLVAVGEKLCNLDANEDSRKLENNKTCAIIEPNKNWDEMPEEYATMASEIVSIRVIIEHTFCLYQRLKMVICSYITNTCTCQIGKYPRFF